MGHPLQIDRGQTHNRERLSGWKEIATYLGKSVRAAERWEKKLGLPVHRLHTAGGEIVFAYRIEIERWLAHTEKRRAHFAESNGIQERGNGKMQTGATSMLTGWKRIACLCLSLFFGVGTALFQLGYLGRHHRLDPFTLADLFVSFFMLVSVAGMLRRRRWGDFLNALCWAGFVGIYASALTYFAFFLGAASPRVAVIATAAGLPIALLLIAAHLAAQRTRA